MLALEELLVETDEDLPIVATVIIGFDDNGCLVLEHKIMDYDVPEESRTKYAVVEKQEAYVLAKKVKVSLWCEISIKRRTITPLVSYPFPGFTRQKTYSAVSQSPTVPVSEEKLTPMR